MVVACGDSNGRVYFVHMIDVRPKASTRRPNQIKSNGANGVEGAVGVVKGSAVRRTTQKTHSKSLGKVNSSVVACP